MQIYNLAFSIIQELGALVLLKRDTKLNLKIFLQTWSIYYWYSVGFPTKKCLLKMFLWLSLTFSGAFLLKALFLFASKWNCLLHLTPRDQILLEPFSSSSKSHPDFSFHLYGLISEICFNLWNTIPLWPSRHRNCLSLVPVPCFNVAC